MNGLIILHQHFGTLIVQLFGWYFQRLGFLRVYSQVGFKTFSLKPHLSIYIYIFEDFSNWVEVTEYTYTHKHRVLFSSTFLSLRGTASLEAR